MPHVRPRILIVDHDVDNREMLPVWLDRGQDIYDITTAAACREARNMIVHQRFDVYVLDYLMPEMTGAEFAKEVRALDPNGAIIIYSGMTNSRVRADCASAGADIFLVKPDDLDMLIPTVNEFLAQRDRAFMTRPRVNEQI